MSLGVQDPERALALVYTPAHARRSVAALFALDERLAQIVATTTEPMLGQMRLTWWHEAIAGLGQGDAPAEPLIRELDSLARAGSIETASLLRLVEGWEELLEPLPLGRDALERFAAGRGGGLFAAVARQLAPACEARAVTAGEAWALVDLAFHLSDRPTAALALDMARGRFAGLPASRWPRAARALGVLDALARRDARAGLDASRRPGSPGRVARAFWRGVTGR